MADSERKPLPKASELIVIQRDSFPILDSYPIEALTDSTYARLEKLASWFVLRAPLTELTRLANLSLLDLFESGQNPSKGSRSANKSSFDSDFLSPFGLDCTKFEFVYSRKMVKPQMDDLGLLSNSSSAFEDMTERCVCFVGKNDSGKEDSCAASFCRHIRNSIAHGRIAIIENDGEPAVFFEDGAPPRDIDYGVSKPAGQKLEIRFRAVIKLSTIEGMYRLLADSKARL